MQFDLTDRDSLFSSLPKGGIGAEVGVAWGVSSKEIIRLTEPSLMYLVDCWEHQSFEVCGDDQANTAQSHKDGQYRQVLGWFVTDPKVRVVKAFSVKAALAFPDGYFDWVYIDANHLQCYEDIKAWWPKIKPGGWLLGDDYIDTANCFTVETDVNRFVAESGHQLQVAIDANTAYKHYVISKPR